MGLRLHRVRDVRLPCIESKLLKRTSLGYVTSTSPGANCASSRPALAPLPQCGEILIRGPALTKGYLNRPDSNEDNAIFTKDGWFQTGDLGQWDARPSSAPSTPATSHPWCIFLAPQRPALTKVYYNNPGWNEADAIFTKGGWFLTDNIGHLVYYQGEQPAQVQSRACLGIPDGSLDELSIDMRAFAKGNPPNSSPTSAPTHTSPDTQPIAVHRPRKFHVAHGFMAHRRVSRQLCADAPARKADLN
ncbi:hypothetical protein BJ912DRAFT_1063611 [Pholiota molesta]|nr:hypothetical protein BJ912DRAFT_1063611 [Pholiota molesta]